MLSMDEHAETVGIEMSLQLLRFGLIFICEKLNRTMKIYPIRDQYLNKRSSVLTNQICIRLLFINNREPMKSINTDF